MSGLATERSRQAPAPTGAAREGTAPPGAAGSARWRRAAGALRVGAAALGRRHLLLGRAVALAVAAAVLALAGMTTVTTHAVYSGLTARNDARAAREPIGDPGHALGGSWTFTNVDDPTGNVMIVSVEPPAHHATFTGSPPPGIKHWPGRGQVYLSPALAHGRHLGAATPWGRLAGVIDPAALATASERVGYARPSDPIQPTLSTPFTRFGGPRHQALGNWGILGDAGRFAPENSFILLTVLFAVLPALALAVVATRVGAPERARRMNLLRALGVGGPTRALVAAGEAAPPAAVGAVVAAVVAFALSQPPYLSLPGAGFTLDGVDLRAHLGAMLAVAAGAFAVVVALSVSSHVRLGTIVSARLTPRRQRGRGWLVLVAVLSELAMLQAPGWHLPGLGLVLVLAVGIVTALLVLPALVGAGMRGLAAVVARPHARRAVLLVLGRQVKARPRVVERVAGAMILTVGLTGVAQLYTSYLAGPQVQARALVHQVNDSLVTLDLGGATPAQAGAVQSAAPATAATLYLTAAPDSPDGSEDLVVDCPALTTLHLPCTTATGQAALERLDPRLRAATPWLTVGSSGRVVFTATAPTTGVTALVFANPRPTPLPVGAIRAAAFQHALDAEVPGEEWDSSATQTAFQSRWFAYFGSAAVIILIAAITVTVTATTREAATPVAPLLLLAGRQRAAWAVAGWYLALPLGAGLALGLGYYLLLYETMLAINAGMVISTVMVTAIAVGGTAMTLGAWVLTSLSLSRHMHRERTVLTL